MDRLPAAYAHCLTLARSHYENFPVASKLMPARIRVPVAVIYAFARTADDFADEGDRLPEERLRLLADYDAKLDALSRGETPDDPVFIALADVIASHRLPLGLFHDLLSAFSQDVTQRRYADFAQLMDYCRRSADPVGRLLLHLYDRATPDNLRLSDRVCSALQLINFYQDLAQDVDENDRIYLPLDEMAAAGVNEAHLRARRTDRAMQNLMDQQITRARAMLLEGAPLGRRLPGRLGLELRLIVQGGLHVVAALERNVKASNAFARPRLGRRDWMFMLGKALFGP